MKRFKSFISTTFLGGLLIVLPLIILFLALNWMFDIISGYIKPMSIVLVEQARLSEFLASIITIIILLGVCFLMGLIIKTRFGHFAYNAFELNILKKIPGFRIIKETVTQLLGSDKNLFSGVALVNLFGNETLLTAFITDKHKDGIYTVFIPSGPAPTAGFVYHLPEKFVHIVDYPVDLAMKTIISLGAGSKNILANYKQEKNKNI